MVRTRQNVWDLPRDANGWSEPLLWYARGVAALKAKPLADPASWRSFAAIHGLSEPVWEHYGYLQPGEARPAAADIARYWEQCQHGTWYFLPWHRGYLMGIEKAVRAAIDALPGDAKPADWALPYWNYFKPGQNDLPPEFATPDWPDGTGDNPLFVSQRWGPDSDGKVTILLDQIDLDAMGESDFSLDSMFGGGLGFGGPDTHRFEHGGRKHGAIESQPHDIVHGLIGGEDEQNPAPSWWPGPHLLGLMSWPPTAGLDPIFYLHHANIDRLWASWSASAGHANPVEGLWLQGPLSIGQRKFSMPNSDGTGWDYTPADMVSTADLGYAYDDLDPRGAAPGGVRSAGDEEEVKVAATGRVEVLGSSTQGTSLVGAEATGQVRLDQSLREKVVASRVERSAGGERVFLNLENVTGLSDATIFKVYLNLPEDENAADHPELLVGSIGLFGVRQASDPDDEHGGQGLDFTLDATRVVEMLSIRGRFDASHAEVRLVSLRPVAEAAKVHIGRISISVQAE